MRRLIGVMLAVVMLGGLTIGAGEAQAGDRRHWRGRPHHTRRAVHVHRGGYFSTREIHLVRDYYRPHYRRAPRHRHVYVRHGYLPRGWHRRIRPYPVYVEREVVVLPRGYRRGVIDGHAVVYDSRGFILDVAVLF